MISGEAEENNTERKARKISYSSRSLTVNANKWALVFFSMEVARVVNYLSCFCWTSWLLQFQQVCGLHGKIVCKQQSHILALVSADTEWGDLGRSASPHARMAGHIKHLFGGYQETSSHAACRKVFLGDRETLSPFYRLKTETKYSLFV